MHYTIILILILWDSVENTKQILHGINICECKINSFAEVNYFSNRRTIVNFIGVIIKRQIECSQQKKLSKYCSRDTGIIKLNK